MKNLILLFSLLGFLMFTSGCKDDDSCDLDALEEQDEDFYDDYYDACFIDADCDDCEEALEDYLDFANNNKSCATKLEDVDEDDIEDFIDELEDLLEEVKDQC